MIWFIGMNDTRVMECTSLYYKLKDEENLDPYWQFVNCARRVLGMGEWDGWDWEEVENDKSQNEELKKFRFFLSISLNDPLDS